MALIKCKECGTEFSDLAPACPKCACPTSAMKEENNISNELSLIKCKNCGKEFLNKDDNCIYCGSPINIVKECKYCSECGSKLNSNDTACNNCGCPVNLMENNNNDDIIVKLPNKNNNKNKILLLIPLILVVLIIIIIFSLGGKNNLKRELIGNSFEQDISDMGISTKSSYSFKRNGIGILKIDIDMPSYLKPTTIKEKDLHTEQVFSYEIVENDIVKITTDDIVSIYRYNKDTKCLTDIDRPKVIYCK